MQKATLLLCLLWTAVAGWAAPRTFTLSSPDRNYEFTLAVEEDTGGATRLYYTLKKPDLPVRARAVILGALGYFILPVDALPDFLPIVGLTDDLGVLAAAAAAVIMYMDDEVKARADAKLESLLGR